LNVVMSGSEFLEKVDADGVKGIDRALALLWVAGKDDPTIGMTAAEICFEVERAGHPKQNVSRLDAQLRGNRGTSRGPNGSWRLHPRARRELDSKYSLAVKSRAPQHSDSVLPSELFAQTRNYIERVVEQINQSYDLQLWDCTAVMCRRLLETLVIETYEKAGRADEIKSVDGNFLMLNGLIQRLENDPNFHLGRNASKGLRDFKQLGDLSAHNRRFNARQNDIDRVRDGLRIAAEELLHLACMV